MKHYLKEEIVHRYYVIFIVIEDKNSTRRTSTETRHVYNEDALIKRRWYSIGTSSLLTTMGSQSNYGGIVNDVSQIITLRVM